MGDQPSAFGSTPFVPVAASTYADDVDKLFWVLTALTVFFVVIVFAVGIALAVYYRRGNKVDRSRPVGHNTLLEIGWSLPPLLLGLGVFFWSAKVYTNVYTVPKNAKEVFVIGKQWMWHLQHANGIRENNELHLPVNEPVKIVMISQDVIHAFYIPEFRMQRQTQPGQYTTFWFTPTRVGKYHLYCNMYCGTQHSEMGGWVYVQSRGDYQKWTESVSHPVATGGYPSRTGDLTPAQRGAAIYEGSRGQCASCHSPEAVLRGRGPSLIGLFGKTRQLQNGSKVVADDGYLRNVLYFPSDYALAGWQQGMPSYKGVLSEDDVLAVNAYVKSLAAEQAVPPGPKGAASTVPQTEKPVQNDGGADDPEGARAANTDNQQWRFMYGGER